MALGIDDLKGVPLRSVLTRYFTELGQMSTVNRVETVALMGAAVHSTNMLGRPELAVELSHFVAHARAVGEIDAQTDPKRVGMLLASAYFAVLTAWISEDPAPFDLTEELVASLDILLSGIMSQRLLVLPVPCPLTNGGIFSSRGSKSRESTMH